MKKYIFIPYLFLSNIIICIYILLHKLLLIKFIVKKNAELEK